MTNILFEHVPIHECGEELVNLKNYDFVLDSQYFNQGFSSDSNMYLRLGVAEKLASIQKTFNGKFRFKIWDGFRPREVQNNIYQKFWKDSKIKHPDWSDPELTQEVGLYITIATNLNRIPPHSTGGAVDLTLVDKNGKELEMGTVFDHFGLEAHPMHYEENDINDGIKQNRRLLREIMLQNGFRNSADEWWHFDHGDQIWAVFNGEPHAFYGEAPTPAKTA
ncbi:MAG: hypothetical protein M3M85_00840 [bacterium]|nr:hypothetical protein [bacterium]